MYVVIVDIYSMTDKVTNKTSQAPTESHVIRNADMVEEYIFIAYGGREFTYYNYFHIYYFIFSVQLLKSLT